MLQEKTKEELVDIILWLKVEIYDLKQELKEIWDIQKKKKKKKEEKEVRKTISEHNKIKKKYKFNYII